MILHGDALETLRTLESDSVQCCMTSPKRNSHGQFLPGAHWRSRKPHWDKSWLAREYTELGRSASDIAAEMGCKENNILYWLHKHGIPARDVSAARKVKRWGLSGKENPMYGRTGPDNPNYRDGSTPERQRMYGRGEGRAFLKAVYHRDGYRCQRCNAPHTSPRSLHAHHIQPWAGHPALRFEMTNVVTLCRACHSWVHSKANTDRDYLKGGDANGT